MNCIDKVLTEKEIDDLVKDIMSIPVKNKNNCVSTYGNINVDDLISNVKEFKKIPTFDNLLKENQKLKEQQKEFIEWLEKYIFEKDETRKLHEMYSLSEERLSSQYFVLQDVLSKYKEIIGGKE